MQILQHASSKRAETLASHGWPKRISRELADICEALGARGCGWLCDFLGPRAENADPETNAILRFTHINQQKTLLTYNMDVFTDCLSEAEMAAILSYQDHAWTPNLQNWPVTIWSKSFLCAHKRAPRSTICIPLHGPHGTKSIVFIPLMDEDTDWYAAALRCIGPLLAAEQDLRSIFSPPYTLQSLEQSIVQSTGALSSEEFESLRWAAKGKTAWESARIQGISERAVIHRLRRAREKLGASSTALAIATASRLGHLKA